jgi:hypothetical protein
MSNVVTFRGLSRKDYPVNERTNTIETLNSGSFQRIADAIEKMADCFTALYQKNEQQKNRIEALLLDKGRVDRELKKEKRNHAATRRLLEQYKGYYDERQKPK